MYALKCPETRRQYPRRLKVFLDFLVSDNTSLDEQALKLLNKIRDNPRWFEDKFMDLIYLDVEMQCKQFLRYEDDYTGQYRYRITQRGQ